MNLQRTILEALCKLNFSIDKVEFCDKMLARGQTMDKNYLEDLSREEFDTFLVPALAKQAIADDIAYYAVAIIDDFAIISVYGYEFPSPILKLVLNPYVCIVESIDVSVDHKFNCDKFYSDWKEYLTEHFDDYADNLIENSI